ncbi:hypothetical protein KUV35_01110 [Marinobacter salsuginis]|uniref:hypothetical protein n=1 Tax=Marinobacter salsuginis TaxID=418719 RepID=UPI001C9834F5|nr:hypothetical protein [Marinobacter salsuginis]MBY6069879.1 hypothetical protein [Marinobacter salsuginis]
MESKEERRRLNSVIRKIYEGLLASGDLTAEDLEDGETLRSKVLSLLDGPEIQFSIDHRDKLLPNAEQFANEGSFELALMFYATYYEHTINGIIGTTVHRLDLSANVTKGMLRTVNLEGKLTWVLEVLGLPIFNANYLKTIKKVSEARNAFIHYKWQPTPGDIKSSSEHKLGELAVDASKAANYFKKFEARCLFKGNKGRLHRAIKS